MAEYDEYITYRDELRGMASSSSGVSDTEWKKLADLYVALNGNELGAETSIVQDVFEGSFPENLDIEKMLGEQLSALRNGKEVSSNDTSHDNVDFGADPVMLFSGQFVHNVDDIHINGAGLDFIFQRTYKNQAIFNGPLGYNWTHNFHIWLRVGDQVIFRSTGDLREEPFTRHPLFDETNLVHGDFDYWVSPDGKHGVIFAENNSFVLRQPNGSRQIFEPDPVYSFLHRLSRTEDRFGNYLQLRYDNENQRLAFIEINQSQRVVSFEYDTQGRICLISDYTDRKWTYTYDSIGDLIAATSPSTDRYNCGLTVNYDYSSAFQTGVLQHNLTRIIDAAGQIYLETEYDTSDGTLNFNRVVRQRQGGGEYYFEYEDIDEVFDFDYSDELRPTHQTILTERNGQPVRHIYNKFGNLLMREQCIIENGVLRTLIEYYRYNQDGNVVSSLSPEGVLTQYLYGRDYFIRHHPLTENGDIPTDDLTWKVRQAFGRIRAIVRRDGYASFSRFTMTQGIWGDFPDILNGPFPANLLDRSQDIIVKMTYEEEFGQLLTVSDPRYTNSANPDEPNEHQRHEETLTKYFYSGSKQFLIRIEHPTPFLPNGDLGENIIERFAKPDLNDPTIELPAYDSNGRLQRSINPVGVVTELSYFDDANELSQGHLHQTIVDPDGFSITIRNEVDELGRVTTVYLPKSIDLADDRFVTRTVYNDLDQIIETTSSAPFSFQTRRFYDRTGKVEREESDLRDENGQSELGGVAVATFCYDEEFNLVETTVGGIELDAHLVTKHGYDNAGKQNLTILSNGNQMRTRYDERQLPVAQISGAGSDDASTTRIEYDGDGRIIRSYDARGNSMTFEFDAFDRIIAEEDALGHITRTNYDKASNITCVRVFEKRDNGYFLLARSETNYDEINRGIRSGVNRFEVPVGPFEHAELNIAELSSPGSGDLLETKTFYDANSRVVKIIDRLEREVTSQYDNLDRLILVTDPLSNETHNQFDDHNNVIRTDRVDRVLAEDGTEISKRFFASTSTYDELDRQTSSTDSLGNVFRLFYDSRGNVVRQVDPLGNEQRSTFDIFNRPNSSSSFLTANGLGPVTAEAVQVTTQQKYDSNGNLTAVIDALGRKTRYQYDALDRRRAIIYPDESKVLTDYDQDSNIIRTQDNNGLQRLYTVDELSRTTRVDVDTSGLPADLVVAGATFERYEYDCLDRQIVAENDFSLCAFRYNSLSWQLDETVTFSVNEAPIKTPFTITREFNNVGALVGIKYPDGRKLQIERDDLDRRINTKNLANGNNYPGDPASSDNRSIAQMTYAGQQRHQCIFANGASATYSHDGAARVIEIAHSNPNAQLLAIQYLYDAVSNVRVRNDVLQTGQFTERFAYDSLYRLAHEFKPDTAETFDLSNFGSASTLLVNPLPDRQSSITALIGSLELPQIPITYDYDLVGNRDIERIANGNNIHYEVNQLDQYTSRNGTNYSHDSNGNLKKEDQQRFSTYDSLNRLVVVDEAGGNELAHFWHDALGRRILEQTSGNTTQLICDGNDVIAEYRDGGLFAQYVFDDGIDRPLHIAAERLDHWFHADLVGSVRLLTDITGIDVAKYRYLSFGAFEENATNERNIFNPRCYAARRLDAELETYNYRARQYTPKIGRFVQRDPKGMIDGTNIFAYVVNSPISSNDPLGYSRNETWQPAEFTVINGFKSLPGRFFSSIPGRGVIASYEALAHNSVSTLSALAENAHPAPMNFLTLDKLAAHLEYFGKSSTSKFVGKNLSKLSFVAEDLIRLPAQKLPSFFSRGLGFASKFSLGLAPIGVESNIRGMRDSIYSSDKSDLEKIADFAFGFEGLVSSSIGTIGLVGVGLKSIGLSNLGLPILNLATKLGPLGLITGSLAGGYAGGQYLDEKIGWSDTLGARAKAHRKTCGGGYFCAGIGGVSAVPVVSDVGNTIGWSASRLVLGFTDENYTYNPLNASWWPGN